MKKNKVQIKKLNSKIKSKFITKKSKFKKRARNSRCNKIENIFY